MKAFALALLVTVIATVGQAQGPLVTIKHDNSTFTTDYQTRSGKDCEMWEESIVMAPAGPCTVKYLYVYWAGDTPATDTLWVVGDPAEGGYQPTSWVWSYNALIDPIIFHYDGKPGWDTVDISNKNLHLDGFQRLWLQHRMKSDGAFFGLDKSSGYSGSLIMDITGQLIPGYDIPGSIDTVSGSFMARIGVVYDFPKGTGSEAAPKATMVDATKVAGLVDTTKLILGATRVAVVDWNGDGNDDVQISNFFFENKGDGTFKRRYDLGISAGGGAVWGDFDNDGKIDCYANNGGAGDKLYRNIGDGTFADVTATSTISNPYPTVTPMWFDYDRDGWLDLFIANGRTEDAQGNEEYFADQLWHNNHDGTFTNTTASTGIGAGEPSPFYDCWTASIGDYNNDLWPDVFVGTYRLAPDLLHRNDAGHFTEVGRETHVVGVPTVAENSFGHGAGSEFGDYDNDGNTDLIVGNLGHPDWRGQFSNPSLLFHNDGPPNYTFTEVHKELGIKFFEMNFGAMWLDIDNDGWLDLWHCQYAYNNTNSDSYRRSRLYRNSGPDGGFKFQDITWNTGANIHGAWTAAKLDFDNDGDMDILAISPTAQVKLFRNDIPNTGNWIKLRLTGDPLDNVNRDCYGAKVVAFVGGRKIFRELNAGGGNSTGTQSTNQIHLGIGTATKADRIEITYPNGKRRTLRDVTAGQTVSVPYEASQLSVPPQLIASSGFGIRSVSVSERELTMAFHGAERSPIEVCLIDMLGRTIARFSTETNHGEARMSLPEVLGTGTYLVRAVSNNVRAIAKLSTVR